MSLINAPADIADLHPSAADWARDMPWHWSKRSDHFETTFSRTGARVRVYIHRNIIKDGAAALWETTRQIKVATNPRRRRKQGRRR